MTTSGHRQIIPVSDPAALAKAAAERLLVRITENGGRIAICLTGGSTPKQLYQLLATDSWRAEIPWAKAASGSTAVAPGRVDSPPTST